MNNEWTIEYNTIELHWNYVILQIPPSLAYYIWEYSPAQQ